MNLAEGFVHELFGNDVALIHTGMIPIDFGKESFP